MGDFYDQIKNVLFFGKFTGTVVFQRNNEKWYKSVLYHLPFYITYGAITFMMYNTVLNAKAEGIYMRMGNISLYVEHMFFLLGRFPYYIYRRNLFNELLEKITAASSTFRLQQRFYAKELAVYLTLIIAYIIILLSKRNEELYVAYVLYFINTMQELYDELLYYLILKELHKQYRYINDDLLGDIKFLNIERVIPVGLGHKNGNLAVIKMNEKSEYMNRVFYLCECHKEISKVCKLANAILGIPALCFCSMVFTTITLNVHHIALHLRRVAKGSGVDGFFMLIAVLEIVAIMFRFVVSIGIVSRVTLEAKSTIIYLHKLWNNLAHHNEIDLNAKHLKLLVVQLYNLKPVFSTNGLFVIDWPVILMIIGAMATYVVILIQFEIALGIF